jgi:protein-S-isoprenylcysteine O-methyltransferase Ste14
MGHLEAIALTLTVCMAFGLVHSLLVSAPAKALAVNLSGEQKVKAFYRLGYTLISIVTTAVAIYLLILIPDIVLFKGPKWWGALMYVAKAAGLVIGVLALSVIDLREFLGLRQAARFIRGGNTEGDIEGMTEEGFITSGVFGMVRHPLYFAGIIIFACQPVYTRNWLTVSVLAILYFIYGALVEEKRMLKRFGQEYENYMIRVPRLIPRLFKKNTN